MISAAPSSRETRSFGRDPAPSLKGPKGRLHGLLGVFRAGLLVNAHHLRRPRRIQRSDLPLGLEPLAPDNQVVFAAQLAGHQVQRCSHRPGIFGVLKSVKGSFLKLP